MTERFRSPLWCWRHCLLAPPLTAHFPFPPGRRRWLKITLWWPALQRAARAAKGKDNVLAALIGVCGCHILITSLKKGRGDERKKRKRLHYATVQGMQSKFLWSWASWSSLGKLFTAHLFAERDRTRRGGEMGAGTNQAARPWVPDSEHNCPHFRQMPTLGGIRLATCLEPDREAEAHQLFPRVALEAVSLQIQKVRSYYSLRHVHFPGAQTLRAKMPFANLSAPSRAGGSRGVPSLVLD